MSKKRSQATRRANAQRAAERAAAMRREQERGDRRRRTLVVGGVVLGVLALVLVAAVVVQSTRDTTGEASTPPSGVVDTYGVPFGVDGAPVTVEVYEDFMCPFCGEFELAAGNTLKEYAGSGDVAVRFKAVAFLDGSSEGTDYSTRAMNAVGVVLDHAGSEAAVELHDRLFANQPAEGTPGLSDDELVELAVESGARRAAVDGPIEDRKFEQWVENANDDASENDVTSTPTVLVNGEPIEFGSTEELLAELKAAVDAALDE